MLERKTLSNDLVKLVPLIKDDFELLYFVASDPEIWELHPDKMRYTNVGFTKYFKKLLETDIPYLIIDIKDETVIGATSYYEYNEESKSVAIGYTFLAKSYWGGKYNQSVKSLMMDYAFQDVDEVIFHVREGNLRSQGALTKIGAKQIGSYLAEEGVGTQLIYAIQKTKN